MNLLNRCALIVTPKPDFINWLNKLCPEDPILNFSIEKNDESKIFLISDDESNFDAEKMMKKYYKIIFEVEISNWFNDDIIIPKLTWKLFNECFDYSVQSMIIDLSKEELICEEY